RRRVRVDHPPGRRLVELLHAGDELGLLLFRGPAGQGGRELLDLRLQGLLHRPVAVAALLVLTQCLLRALRVRHFLTRYATTTPGLTAGVRRAWRTPAVRPGVATMQESRPPCSGRTSSLRVRRP